MTTEMPMDEQFFRQVAILSGDDDWLQQQLRCFFAANAGRSAVYTAAIPIKNLPQNGVFYPFSQAKNLLGQAFELAIYDARQADGLNVNLEALAIVAATVKAGGVLLLVLPEWQQLRTYPDYDSRRWNGTSDAIVPQHFYRWLQEAINAHQIPCYQPQDPPFHTPRCSDQRWQLPPTALQQQTQVLNHILAAQQDCYLLTAARGRGKSALAGMLAETLGRRQRVWLTAPNQRAVQTLYAHCQHYKPHFIAPDALAAQLAQDPEAFASDWLIVDEAAMIPLEMLTLFSHHFQHILFTTTIHGYEGTGRGFELKFKPHLQRSCEILHLQQPLRYPQNDPLERWIQALLCLAQSVSDNPLPTHISDQPPRLLEITQPELVADRAKLLAVYRLLTLAHYRTSPLDLRRLLDGQAQHFWLLQHGREIGGAIWAIAEGGIQDPQLIAQIWRGERRPSGNLVAQALCFQADLPAACELRSLRISRIALLPLLQRQGLGQQLVRKLIADCRGKLDFISVSFGYSDALADFWQKCGFTLLHLSSRTEASSGCYSAMAIYPLSAQGEHLCQQGEQQFLRNFPLSEHPLLARLQQRLNFPPIDWQLAADDQRQLHGFAHANRTLVSTYPALRRLAASRPHLGLSPLLQLADLNKKLKLARLRQKVAEVY